MEIEKASPTGFCFGVRRAIQMMERAATERGQVASLGEVVHNRQVARYLEGLGVREIGHLEEAGAGAVAIPSHGAGPHVFQEAEARKISLIDATCPIVRRAQRKAQEMAQAGFKVVIFGDPDHPEVKGILAWAGPQARVTTDPRDLLAKPPRRLGLLSQTTQTPEGFSRFVSEIVELCLARLDELRVVNTICQSVHLRQQAVQELARRVDLMLVVGGRHSANTRRLAQLCQEAGVETRHIEVAQEIEPAWLRGKGRVGVAAGTSTPDDVVAAVMARLQGNLAAQSKVV